MLGPPKARCLDRPVLVSLEALVPPGHFYRHLEATLDLGFVRAWVADRYAARGRPSIDPVVFFKLQLVMFFEGIRSERRLIETASLHLAQRWYLGYALDEPLPDHSSLTRIRERLGLATFRRFFEAIVEQCRAAGLVWGEELIVDATQVRANAAVGSLAPRLRAVVDDHLVDLFGPGRTQGDDDGATAAAGPAPAAPEADDAPVRLRPGAGEDAAPPPRWDLLETCRLDPERPGSRGYARVNDVLVSRTDPDAALMRRRSDHPQGLGYHAHYLVDGGRHRIILHALITPADVMDNQPLLDQLRRAMFRWRLRPRRVIADAGYGATENIRGLEEAGIQAYIPLTDFDHRTAFFGRDRFTYDAQRDEYRCPAGQPLPRHTAKYGEEVVTYRAEAAACNACPLKAHCTDAEHGRTIQRSVHEAHLERVRGYRATADFKRAMRKRQVWVEPLFGEAKQWHGLRQFRLRGLARVNTEGLLIAAGQNLKRLLTATGWGRRHGPCGSLCSAASTSSPRMGLV
jgi:transposase